MAPLDPPGTPLAYTLPAFDVEIRFQPTDFIQVNGVLNETAVREAGFPSNEAALGKQAVFWGMQGEVVGVVRDFHTRGLQQAVEPIGIVVTDFFQNVLTLRIRTARERDRQAPCPECDHPLRLAPGRIVIACEYCGQLARIEAK